MYFSTSPMDLDLKNIGQTIAIGGVVVYTLIIIGKIFFPNWQIRFFHSSENKTHLQEAAVSLALIFAIGLVLEDVSKNISSGREYFSGKWLNYIVDSDRNLRFKSFFDVNNLNLYFSKIENKNSSLYNAYYVVSYSEEDKIKEDADARFIAITIKAKENYAENKIAITDELISAANGFFYIAKNNVYAVKNYFDELTEIESRVDFTRSLTLLCFIFFIIFGALTFFGFTRPILKKFGLDIEKTARNKSRSNNSKRYMFYEENLKVIIDRSAEKQLKLAGLTLIFFISMLISASAFRTESDNYNRRVYGYNFSILYTIKNSALTTVK